MGGPISCRGNDIQNHGVDGGMICKVQVTMMIRICWKKRWDEAKGGRLEESELRKEI